MRIQLYTHKEECESEKEAYVPALKRLPMSIDTSAEGDVNARNWMVHSFDSGAHTFVTSFRGRCLYGSSTHLPAGFSACVLQHQKDQVEQEKQQFEQSSHFPDNEDVWVQTGDEYSRIGVYRHEHQPTESDPLIRALEWLHVANALHGTTSKHSEAAPEGHPNAG